jgi:hypothetical protein
MRRSCAEGGRSGRCQVRFADLSFGLNVRPDGSIYATTKAHAIDYQLIPREGCEITGHWVATYGVEDARIFWTVSAIASRVWRTSEQRACERVWCERGRCELGRRERGRCEPGRWGFEAERAEVAFTVLARP